ncbi:unnamed protein product [Orchesella dallaii]|uniref:Uncharacterized protein n=1 Tax=Orchesella dallaii TaxID=48710 RepID=A0ABP1RP35_9HEXA
MDEPDQPTTILRGRLARRMEHAETPPQRMDLYCLAQLIFEVDHMVTWLPANLLPPIFQTMEDYDSIPAAFESQHFYKVMATYRALVVPGNNKYLLTSVICYVLTIFYAAKNVGDEIIQVPEYIAATNGSWMGGFGILGSPVTTLRFGNICITPADFPGAEDIALKKNDGRTRNVRLPARYPRGGNYKLEYLQMDDGRTIEEFLEVRVADATKNLKRISATLSENVQNGAAKEFVLDNSTNATENPMDIPCELIAHMKDASFVKCNAKTGTSEMKVQTLPSKLSPEERRCKICNPYLQKWNENVGFAIQTGTVGTKVQDWPSRLAPADHKWKICPRNGH